MERMGSGWLDHSALVYGYVKIYDLSGYKGRGVPIRMPPVVSLGSQRHRAFTRALTRTKTDRKQKGSIRSARFFHLRPPARRSALIELPGARAHLRPFDSVHGGAYINSALRAEWLILNVGQK